MVAGLSGRAWEEVSAWRANDAEDRWSSSVCPVGAVSMTTYRPVASAMVRAQAWKTATSWVRGDRRSSVSRSSAADSSWAPAVARPWAV